MIGCLRKRVRKQPIIVLEVWVGDLVKFYNLEARPLWTMPDSYGSKRVWMENKNKQHQHCIEILNNSWHL